MLIDFLYDADSIILRVKILDSSVATGAGLTGLTNTSAGLIISTIADNEATPTTYTQAAGNIETIATLGTYQAPTAGKCRFKEVDANNHPGIYEIHLADARYAVNNCKSLLVSVSGAANCAESDCLIPLRANDPFGGAGRGARTVLVTVNDGTDPIENAIVRYSVDSAHQYWGTTNASGQTTLNLDDATYDVAISKSGYSFTQTTHAVSGNATPTYSMTLISIPSPPSASTCTGVMTCYDDKGQLEMGVEIHVRMLTPPGSDGLSYDFATWTETSDAIGEVAFDGMMRGAVYEVWRGDTIRKKATCTVPSTGNSFNLPETVGMA